MARIATSPWPRRWPHGELKVLLLRNGHKSRHCGVEPKIIQMEMKNSSNT